MVRGQRLTQSFSIKKWKCPEGTFVFNFPGHEAIINTLSVNEDGVLFSGGTLTKPRKTGNWKFTTRSNQVTTVRFPSGITRRANRSSISTIFLRVVVWIPRRYVKCRSRGTRIDSRCYQGVFCSTFDKTGTRLITGGADKTIKVSSRFRILSGIV